MIKMSKMSKILNGLRDYDQVRNEDEEDQQRTLLFEHLAEATDSYKYGCDMLLLLRLQLAFGMEEYLYEVMYTKATKISEKRNNIKNRMSYVETVSLRSCMNEITSNLDRKGIDYKKVVFNTKNIKLTKGSTRKAGHLIRKYYSKRGHSGN